MSATFNFHKHKPNNRKDHPKGLVLHSVSRAALLSQPNEILSSVQHSLQYCHSLQFTNLVIAPYRTELNAYHYCNSQNF